MKTYATPKRLSEEAESFILANAEKFKLETNIAVFSKEEKLKIQAVYFEITGKPASVNCNGLCPKAIQIIKNWLTWYETTQIPTVEEFAPVEEVDLESFTKRQLEEMYPEINPKLRKADFIAAIQNGQD